jgi:flagellar capping protein FliD
MDGAMSSPTQFLGIVSGTDWNSIINQLVAVERQPLDKLYTQRSQLQLQQSLTIKANSQLLSLNDALSALRFQSTFLSRKVTASNPSQVDATASVGAATGTYNLSVSRLAAPGRATSGLGGTLFSKVANLSPQQTMGIAGAQPNGGSFQATRALSSTLIKDTQQAGQYGAAITKGDTISISGKLKDGTAVSGTFTFNGDSTDTLQRLGTTIAQVFQGQVGASVGSNGELVFLETNPTSPGDITFNPATDLTFNDADFSGSTLTFAVGNNVAGGGATTRRQVNSVTFTTAGVPVTNTATDLAALDQVTGGLDAGDKIHITGTESNGSAITAVDFTYTGAAGGQTIQDLLDTINGAYTSATAVYNNGRIELIDNATGTSQSSLQLSFTDSGNPTTFKLGSFSVAEPGRAQTAQMVTTAGFTVEGTGTHLLSSSNGRAGQIVGSVPISDPSDTLGGFLGVTDFSSFTIDPDGQSGPIGAVTITGLSQYSTVQDLVDAINAQVPSVTAQLKQSGANYVFQLTSNTGGRNVSVYDSANGIMQGIIQLSATELDSVSNDGVTTFGATTANTDVTMVDLFTPANGGPAQRRVYTGVESTPVGDLIGGVTLSGTGNQFNAGVATVVTANSDELNTTQATRSYVFGSSAIAATPPTTVPAILPNVPLAQAGFATTPQNASSNPGNHTDGIITINGVQINIGDVTTTTLNQVLGAINSSGAGVTAVYDAANARVYLRSNTPGSNPITVGGAGDTSNFLRIAGLLPANGGISISGQAAGTVSLALPAAQGGYSTQVTSGIFTINGVKITIDAGVDTTNDILNKINNSGAGVKATYDPTSDHITLTQVLDANTTASQIQVGDPSDTSNFLEAANLTADTTVATYVGSQRQTALLSVDGVDYTRNSNTVSDIVDNVTFNLNGVTNGTDSITVTANTQQIQDALLNFVVQWNTTMQMLNVQPLTSQQKSQTTALTTDQANNMTVDDINTYNQNRNDLLAQDFYANDAQTRSVVYRLQGLMMGFVNNDGPLHSLADIGITTSPVGGGVDAAETSQGRFLGQTTDKDQLTQLMQDNTTLQDEITNHSDDLFQLFAAALNSQVTRTGNVNLANGVNLASPLRFTIGDGTKTATINLSAGVHSQSDIQNTINQQLLNAGLSNNMLAFFDAQNQLNLRSSSTTDQVRLQIQDQSPGISTLLNSLGWSSGLFLGPDITETGGIAQRSRGYISDITGIDGLVESRIKQGGSFDQEIQVYNDEIQRGEDYISQYTQQLRNKFANLETQLSQLQSQSAALTSALGQSSSGTVGSSSSSSGSKSG